jgi:hypothetical protein
MSRAVGEHVTMTAVVTPSDDDSRFICVLA